MRAYEQKGIQAAEVRLARTLTAHLPVWDFTNLQGLSQLPLAEAGTFAAN